MAKTQIYGLGYLQAFEDVGGSGDIDMDELRFKSIENQQYGIYSLFGNGIREDTDQFGNPIPSWLIENVAGSSNRVLITPGHGHVAWKYAETNTVSYVDIIPPQGNTGNLVFYIYATATNTTPYDKSVKFIASTQVISDIVNYVGIGGVIYTISSDGSVTLTPMNTEEYGRRVISFFGVLSGLINKHKHIGGATNPSPIDLSKHVQGKLDGDYISDLDASKINNGVLPPERLPKIDHNTLLRRGTLTHDQIDSLIAMLSYHSDKRMSDIEITNLLQLGLGLKRVFGRNSHIHKNLINTIFYIPGITLDKFASWYNTDEIQPKYPLDHYGLYAPFVPSAVPLADIDTINKRIVGINTNDVSNDFIIWDTDIDFTIASRLVAPLHAQIVGIGSSAYITIQQPVNYIGICTTDFDDKWKRGYVFDDYSVFLNAPQSITAKDTFYDDYSVARYVYYEFPGVIDIRGRDMFGIGFGVTNNSVPGAINFFFIVNNGGTQHTFVQKNGTLHTIQTSKDFEIYSSDDSNRNDYFVYQNIDSFGLTEDQKAHIVGVGISYSVDNGWNRLPVSFSLYSPTAGDIINSDIYNPNRLIMGNDIIDDPGRSSDTSAIFAWNQNMYYSEADFTFRFDSGYKSTIYSDVSCVFEQPANTELIIRTRTSDTLDELQATNFYVVSNSSIDPASKSGRYIDINIQFFSSNNRLLSPSLDKVTLSFYGPGSAQVPKMWDNASIWQSGRFINVCIDGDILNHRLQPVSVASTNSAIDLPNPIQLDGEFIVDGYVVKSGDRVLLSCQTDIEITNGIYVYDNENNILQRANDLYSGCQFDEDMFCVVLHGLSCGGKTFRIVNDGIVDSDPIVFSEYKNDLRMCDTSVVGRFVYIRDNLIYFANRPKNNPNSEQDEYVYQDGAQLYRTPRQVFEKLAPGYYSPEDIYILSNNNIVVVDTGNDRVVEICEDGSLVKAIQGNLRLREADRDFVICSAIYNPQQGRLWMAFSQNAFIRDKSKISISGGSNHFAFSDSNPSNANDVINVSPFNPIPNTDTFSSTWVVNFSDYFNNMIKTWSRPLTLTIAKGAFRCKGKSSGKYRTYDGGVITSGISIGGASGSGGGGNIGGAGNIFSPYASAGNSLPTYVTGPPPNYILPQSGIFDGVFDMTGESLSPIISGREDGGDFDNNGVIDNADSDSTILLGPDGSSDLIKLDVVEGNILFDNLYNPISIQVTGANDWIVASVGDRGVLAYDSALNRLWSISSEYVNYNVDSCGNAYQLDSGYVLASVPSQGTASTSVLNQGSIYILNQKTSGNPIIAQIRISGNPIRAYPNVNNTEFWVCVNDSVNGGLNSGVIRVDYSGNVTWKFAQRNISSPSGFRILYNGDLLVSE